MICLDTNVVIGAINNRVPGVRARLSTALASQSEIGVPAVVLFELWYGIGKSTRPDTNIALLRSFMRTNVVPLPFEAADAEEAGEIRAVLERAGNPIGPYDILIAAQARRRSATLVTANTREFARVPGLRIEDWTLP